MRKISVPFFLNSGRRSSGEKLLFSLLCLAFVVHPHLAFAQADTLGDMLCTVTSEMVPGSGGGRGFGVLRLIQGFAYITGAIFIGTGLMNIIHHYDGGREQHHRKYQIIARLLGGTMLLALPATIAWLFRTFALVSSGTGVYSSGFCAGGIAASDSSIGAFGTGGLDTMMINLVENIADPMTLFLSILAVIIGMILVFKGLTKAAKYGTDPRSYSVPNILINLFVGAVLITVGTSLNWVFNTIFGIGGIMSSSAFWTNFALGSFVASSGFSASDLAEFELVITEVLTFFQIVGFIAFIRGWLILKDSVEGSGQAKISQGLTHIFGGALAINIYQILDILDTTFGTGFIT